ncbi:hypothetical protein MTO96_005302 [Rhipicephalus appendiculatus]
MLVVLVASLLGPAAATTHAELPWSRVAPGVSAEACDSAPGSDDRLYWLRDGQRLPSPTPDRFWEPGAYLLLVSGRFVCGCSLIAQRWALTAAHCLPERDDAQLAVLLGATRQSGPRISVLRAVPHPGYVRGTPLREHDVALLLLERRSERLTVACLPPARGLPRALLSGRPLRLGPRRTPRRPRAQVAGGIAAHRHQPQALRGRRGALGAHWRFAQDSARLTAPTPVKGTAEDLWSASQTGDLYSWASSAGDTRARGPSPSACTRA